VVKKNEIQPQLNSKKLRDELNTVFQNKGYKGPIVAKVTKSLKDNIVITTTKPEQVKTLESSPEVIEKVLSAFKISHQIIPTP
jgi:hypothetical protein